LFGHLERLEFEDDTDTIKHCDGGCSSRTHATRRSGMLRGRWISSERMNRFRIVTRKSIHMTKSIQTDLPNLMNNFEFCTIHVYLENSDYRRT